MYNDKILCIIDNYTWYLKEELHSPTFSSSVKKKLWSLYHSFIAEILSKVQLRLDIPIIFPQ